MGVPTFWEWQMGEHRFANRLAQCYERYSSDFTLAAISSAVMPKWA